MLLDMRPLQGPSADRGVGTYAKGLLGGLIEAGFDSHLTLLLDAGLEDPALPAGGYQVVHTRRRYRGHLAGYEEAAVAGFDLERIKPDVYHAITLNLPGRAPCRLVVTLHDLIPWAWGGPHMRGERMRYWLGKKLLRRADLVVAVSQATADDAVKFARVERDRLRVVSEAADPVYGPRPEAKQRVKQRWGLEPGFLLYVGALDARKDPKALLTAWAKARAEIPGLELVIAGAPGPQAPAQMPGARMLGRIAQSELADLYSAAGCFVFSSRYEGFGLPCLEAMACGCPVAGFRNSSVHEVVNGAGTLVADGDAQALGDAAARMATTPDQWRRAGIERAKQFSWQKAAQQTITAYESVFAGLR